MEFGLGYACASGHKVGLTAGDNTRRKLKFISRAASSLMIIVLVNILELIMNVHNMGPT